MIGSTLAHYEITAHLGSGGMSDVYQATDSKLGRAVAIKMLPEEFTREPERTARLQREARLLAALNHPSIAVIHGIEDADGRAFLVMELVTGETLEERIARGAVPVADALRVGVQIAAALEAAHECGVVHRDLKPANVKVAAGGTVKLLDFGIAKAVSAAMTGAARATTIVGAGGLGTVVGTPAYMSPEQARGQAVDRRTDIFAFGCVLYEMLTGRRAFDGETVTDTIAHVVATDPDWTRLPKELAPRVRELLERCLQKDSRKRQRDAGDVRLDLERALAEPQSRAIEASVLTRLERRSRIRGILATGATAGLAVAVLGAVAFWPAHGNPPPARFTFSSPSTDGRPTALAVSPDGRYVAYVVPSTTPLTPSLFVRELNSFEAMALEGTESAITPFWSPDSRHIGFTARSEPAVLKRVALAGGPPQEIARASGFAGAAWSDQGVIVFSSGNAIWRVPASGGEPVEIARVDAAAGEVIYLLHSFLPGGGRFLYSSPLGTPGVYAQALDSTERSRVLPFAARTQYAAGHLLFNREGTVFAQRFDADRLALSGEPAALGDRAWSVPGNGQAKFAASATVLAYELAREAPRELSRLTWYDRGGAAMGTLGEAADYEGVALSPDGRHVAVHRHEPGPGTSEEGDVWIVDSDRGTWSQLTAGLEYAFAPVWSPDGQTIVYTGPDLNLYREDATNAAAPERIVQAPAFGAYAYDWFGETVLFAHEIGQLSVVPATGGDDELITNDSFRAGLATVSPDGRWIAFSVALEQGRSEIYVRPYPETSRRQWPVSTAGGTAPRWTRDGLELVYLAPDDTFMAVAVDTKGPDVVVGTPLPLFKANPSRERHQPGSVPYDVTPDGERFIVNERIAAEPGDAPSAPNEIAISLNWQPEP